MGTLREALKYSVFAAAIFVALFLVGAQAGLAVNLAAGCEGIDVFYTGEGFENDASNYKNIIFDLYTPNASNTLTNIFAPKDMNRGSNFDCKSISNGIYCLAMKYEVPCRFFYNFRWSYWFTDYEGHQGIECLIDDVWINLY